jgi:aldose 1-epimerase
MLKLLAIAALPALAAALALLAFPAAPADDQDRGVTKAPFGTADGQPVELYTLKNAKGVTVKVMSYGTIVTELLVPDKEGKPADVALGFDTLEGYLGGHPYFGATVGRYANRIAKGKFVLDGTEYTLATNNGPNHLHGGKKGFDKVVWKAEVLPSRTPAVKFSYRSPDGEEGYPGNLDVTCTYTLTNENELRIDFTATTDKPTIVNLAHHGYFNLAGHAAGDILGHELMIAGDHYTATDDTLIPTGEIKPVKGTPFDFTQPTAIGARIAMAGGNPVGYDLNYVLRAVEPPPFPAARVREPKSGRVMEVLTTEPGIQFYSGNFLDGTNKGKGGAVYQKHAGFCLEAQKFPDSPNKPNFPSAVLRPGQTYKQTTIYKFETQ